ncbi:FecR family protein [bacterium A37T11]|nr:FecR family protein [bacterium A37T11]
MNEKEAFDYAAMVIRYLRQEFTVEEEAHFLKLLDSDPEKLRILNAYKDTAEIQQRLSEMNELDLNAAWGKILKRQKAKKKTVKIKWIGYAAALMLAGVLSFLWTAHFFEDKDIVKENRYGYKNDVIPNNGTAKLTLSNGNSISLSNNRHLTEEGSRVVVANGELHYKNKEEEFQPSQEIFNTLQVERGGLYKLILSDGTRVWVNSLSSLRFPVSFTQKERRVFLEGEAYFEIASAAGRPFKVVTNQREILVLGTKFNTKSTETVTTTTLMEGSVKVTNARNSSVLIPGQQAAVSGTGINLSFANMDKVMAWKDGQFYFDHDEIQKIMDELAAWYGVEVHYEGKILAGRYGGSISRKVSLGEVLEMLKDVSDLDFEIEGRKVIVKRDKNV